MEIIGRDTEKQRLERLYNSNSPEFLVVYGRRRVGKPARIGRDCPSLAAYNDCCVPPL
jgi:hypothetical protein